MKPKLTLPGRLRSRLTALLRCAAILFAAGALAATALGPATALAATAPTPAQTPTAAATQPPAQPQAVQVRRTYQQQAGLFQVFYFYASDGRLHMYWQMVRQPNRRLGYYVQYFYPNGSVQTRWFAWGTGPFAG
jgi:hypothetical protein